MRKVWGFAAASLLLLAIATAAVAEGEEKAAPEEKPLQNPVVLIQTSMGDIKVELFQDKAPATVGNFLTYTDDGFYNGTIFHRVINDFMIQGGGFDKKLERKPTKAPIQNEADHGISNERGTIAMARLPEPHTATSQFFINVKDNSFLDHFDKKEKWGYCVFGKVIEGMDVVNKIKKVETAPKPPLPQDVPVQTIEIVSISRVEG